MSAENKTLGDRIRFAAQSVGGIENAANKIGVAKSTAYDWIKNKSDPKISVILQLARLADISVDWLASGEGPLHPSANQDSTPFIDQSTAQFPKIPRYNAKVSAGPGAFNERAEILDYIPFTFEFINEKLGRSNIDGLMIVDVRGDSMDPTIKNDALVIIDSKLKYFSDGIGAFVWGEETYIKRIQKTMKGLKIISDNPQYEPQFITNEETDQLHMVGKIVWCGQVF